jgi:hypothetical protein
MAQKWRWRCCGGARCRRGAQAERIFRNDDRALCHHHGPVRVVKRRREMFAVLRILERVLKGFEQSVTAVTRVDGEIFMCAVSIGQFVVRNTEHLPESIPDRFGLDRGHAL